MPWFRSVLASLWRSFLFCRLKLLLSPCASLLWLPPLQPHKLPFWKVRALGHWTWPSWHDMLQLVWSNWKRTSILICVVEDGAFMPSPVWHRYEIRGDLWGRAGTHVLPLWAALPGIEPQLPGSFCSPCVQSFGRSGGMFSNVWWLICIHLLPLWIPACSPFLYRMIYINIRVYIYINIICLLWCWLEIWWGLCIVINKFFSDRDAAVVDSAWSRLGNQGISTQLSCFQTAGVALPSARA